MRPDLTVILAAGQGSRLRPASGTKPLTRVGGQLLIDRAVEQARAAGCQRAVIVVGHDGDLVRRHLEARADGVRLEVVENPDFQSPNGVSLLAAESRVDGPFYLLMADHVFARPILTRLVDGGSPAPGEGRLLIDRSPTWYDVQDATKVRVENGLLRAIGKDLEAYDAVDTGAFLLDPEVFDALRAAARHRPPSVTEAMREMIAREALAAVELESTDWIDVDTPADLAAAERMLLVGQVSPSE